MIKVGLQAMSTVLLLLLCDGCATQSGIQYGSKIKIKLDAGSDRGKESKANGDEAGLFFSGNFGRIEVGG